MSVRSMHSIVSVGGEVRHGRAAGPVQLRQSVQHLGKAVQLIAPAVRPGDGPALHYEHMALLAAKMPSHCLSQLHLTCFAK